jgi:DNA-binding NtrC family response regulator
MGWARTYEWPGNVRELRDAITRWFFEGGRRTLQQVVEDLRAEETPPEVATTPEMDSTVTALVKARLDSGLAQNAPAPGTLNDFVKEFERAAKRGLSQWYRNARPTDEQLRMLFPAHRTLTSVRNKLSQWRKA